MPVISVVDRVPQLPLVPKQTSFSRSIYLFSRVVGCLQALKHVCLEWQFWKWHPSIKTTNVYLPTTGALAILLLFISHPSQKIPSGTPFSHLQSSDWRKCPRCKFISIHAAWVFAHSTTPNTRFCFLYGLQEYLLPLHLDYYHYLHDINMLSAHALRGRPSRDEWWGCSWVGSILWQVPRDRHVLVTSMKDCDDYIEGCVVLKPRELGMQGALVPHPSPSHTPTPKGPANAIPPERNANKGKRSSQLWCETNWRELWFRRE